VVTFVEAIVARGFAYESNGSVYFHTAAFRAAGHDYPKLKVGLGADDAAASAAEMAEGEGALSQAFSDDKRSASDFVLWKNSKPGEPAWPSPWGNVRVPLHVVATVASLSWLSIRLVFPALPRLVKNNAIGPCVVG
jgi:cysteinyl-tRNA synthetase